MSTPFCVLDRWRAGGLPTAEMNGVLGRMQPLSARTVRTTGLLRARMSIAVGVMAAVLILAMTGCSGAGSATSAGSAETSAPVGKSMAGAAVQVHIPQSVISARPQPWVLSTPESAVRSYLDWSSYAYRIASSDVASPTMSDKQGVRVDSFIQFNLEKSKLLDESLTSISFGKPTVESTHTLVPARELWSYSYRSIAVGNKVLGGPYSLSYDTTYTVIKEKNGTWVVADVAAKALGTVK